MESPVPMSLRLTETNLPELEIKDIHETLNDTARAYTGGGAMGAMPLPRPVKGEALPPP